MRSLTCAVLAMLGTAACGDDPVSYSGPVTIVLKADADKVVTGVITDEKGINTESGNPYGAFITAAENELGKQPARVEVTSVAIFLAPSVGVTMLGEVFDGNVEVLFEMDTGVAFPVAHGTLDETTQGAGPIELAIDWDSSAITGEHLVKLMSGGFKVIYRGPAQAAYAGTSGKADLQITFTFEAFEQ